MVEHIAIEEFTVDFRHQREWSWLIITAFFLGGVGGGLYLISNLIGFLPGAWISLAIVAIGAGGALMLDLGHPERVLRLVSQPRRSWISRGTFFIALFVAFGFLSAIPTVSQFSWLPWGNGTILGQVIQFLALVFALGVTIYTGFVMSHSPSIAFWNSPLLPIVFVTYALMGGISVVFASSPLFAGSIDIATLERFEVGLLIATTILIGAYLLIMQSSTVAAAQSVVKLTKGELALPFLGGVVGIGLLLPLLISLYAIAFISSGAGASSLLAIAGLLDLVGGYFLRYSLLNVGIYSPAI